MVDHVLLSHAGHPWKVNDKFEAKVFATDGSSLLESALGNVPFRSTERITGYNTNVGTDWVDISPIGGPTNVENVIETLEVVSTSTDDDDGGIGAWTVLVQTLDENFAESNNLITLDGTTPVVVPGLHIRQREMTVLSAGSTHFNQGEIILRTAGGGGSDRLKCPIKFGSANSSHYTVPAGKASLAILITCYIPKDEGIFFRSIVKPGAADSAWIVAGTFPVYQKSLDIPIPAPFPLAAGTDVVFQAMSEVNINVPVLSYLDILIVDASSLPDFPDVPGGSQLRGGM